MKEEVERRLGSWMAPWVLRLRDEVKAGNSLRYTGLRVGVRGVAEISQRVMRRRTRQETTPAFRGRAEEEVEKMASLPSEMLAWAGKHESGTPSPNSSRSISAARTFS